MKAYRADARPGQQSASGAFLQRFLADTGMVILAGSRWRLPDIAGSPGARGDARLVVELEDRFDGLCEQTGDAEGERQAGVVATGLQGVDRLPGDLQPVGERALAPAVSLTQHLQLVLHRLRASSPATSQPSMPAL